MLNVPSSRILPILDRISLLSASILLAYTFAGLINLPVREFGVQLPGFYLEITINAQTIVTFLVATLAASGTAWLLQEHPSVQEQNLAPHLLIPALTAWVIGVPLHQQALGTYWWAGILLGGGALILVLVAEYSVVDPNDSNYQAASIGLTIVAYVLFFLLAVTLKASQVRLYLLAPALIFLILVVNLRILYLQHPGVWPIRETGISTLIMAQIIISAYYLPLSPLSFGLFLLGPAYGVINLFGNINAGKSWKEAIPESAVVLVFIWALSIFT